MTAIAGEGNRTPQSLDEITTVPRGTADSPLSPQAQTSASLTSRNILPTSEVFLVPPPPNVTAAYLSPDAPPAHHPITSQKEQIRLLASLNRLSTVSAAGTEDGVTSTLFLAGTNEQLRLRKAQRSESEKSLVSFRPVSKSAESVFHNSAKDQAIVEPSHSPPMAVLPKGTSVRATKAFKAEEPGELELEVGDLIELEEPGVPGEYWWTGVNRSWGPSNGQSGFFPSENVEEEKWETPDHLPQTRFTAANQDEPDAKSNSDGEDASNDEVFSEQEIEYVDPEPPVTVPPGTSVICSYPYDRTKADEMSLEVGDRIVVVEAPEGGWWRGMGNLGSKTPKSGWFPAMMVKLENDTRPRIPRPVPTKTPKENKSKSNAKGGSNGLSDGPEKTELPEWEGNLDSLDAQKETGTLDNMEKPVTKEGNSSHVSMCQVHHTVSDPESTENPQKNGEASRFTESSEYSGETAPHPGEAIDRDKIYRSDIIAIGSTITMTAISNDASAEQDVRTTLSPSSSLKLSPLGELFSRSSANDDDAPSGIEDSVVEAPDLTPTTMESDYVLSQADCSSPTPSRHSVDSVDSIAAETKSKLWNKTLVKIPEGEEDKAMRRRSQSESGAGNQKDRQTIMTIDTVDESHRSSVNLSRRPSSTLGKTDPQLRSSVAEVGVTERIRKTNLLPKIGGRSRTLSAPAFPPGANLSDKSLESASSLPISPISPTSQWHEKLPKEVYQSMSQKEKHRMTAVWELIVTERDYVRDLKLIIEVFMHQMSENKFGNGKNIDALFSNVDELYAINTELLNHLEKLYDQNPIVDGIGQVFLEMGDSFSRYTVYCSNHSVALSKLQSLTQSNRSFRAFLEDIYKTNVTRSMDLGSFLIKPVQRICKYPLLLKEIIKYTEESHKDYPTLKDALESIQAIITEVNAGARAADGVRKMVEVQGYFVEKLNIVSPSRHLVRDDTMNLMIGDLKKSRRIFLFNDLIIVARKDWRDKLHLVEQATIRHCRVCDVVEDGEETNMFEIEILPAGSSSSSVQRRFLFAAPNKQTKSTWLESYRNVAQSSIRKKKLSEMGSLVNDPDEGGRSEEDEESTRRASLDKRVDSAKKDTVKKAVTEKIADFATSKKLSETEKKLEECEAKLAELESQLQKAELSLTEKDAQLSEANFQIENVTSEVARSKDFARELENRLQEKAVEALNNEKRFSETMEEMKKLQEELHFSGQQLMEKESRLTAELNSQKNEFELALEASECRLRDERSANDAERAALMETVRSMKEEAVQLRNQFQIELSRVVEAGERRLHDEIAELDQTHSRRMNEQETEFLKIQEDLQLKVMKAERTAEALRSELKINIEQRDQQIKTLEREKSLECSTLAEEVDAVKQKAKQVHEALKRAVAEAQSQGKELSRKLKDREQEIRILEGQLREKASFAAKLEVENAAQVTEISRVQSALEAIRADHGRILTSMEQSNQERFQAMMRKEAELSEISAKLAQQSERAAHAVSDLEKTKFELTERIKILEDQLIKAREEVSTLKTESARDKDQIQLFDRSLRDAKKSNEALKTQSQHVGEANRRFATEHTKLKDILSKHMQTMERNSREHHELQEKFGRKEQELALVESSLRALKEQFAIKEEELRKAIFSSDRSQAKLQELEKNYLRKEAEVADLSAKLSHQTDRIAHMVANSDKARLDLFDRLKASEVELERSREENLRLRAEKAGEQEQFKACARSLKDVEKQVELLKVKVHQQSDANKRLATDQAKLVESLATKSAALEQLSREKSELDHFLASKNEEILKLESSVESLKTQLFSKDENLAQSTLAADRARAKSEDANNSISRKEAELVELRAKLSHVTELSGNMKHELLEKLRSNELHLSRTLEEISQLKKDNAREQERIQILDKALKDADTQNELLSTRTAEQLNSMEAALKTLKDRYREKELDLTKAVGAADRANAKLEELEKSALQREVELSEAQLKKKELSDRLALLEQSIAQSREEISHLKEEREREQEHFRLLGLSLRDAQKVNEEILAQKSKSLSEVSERRLMELEHALSQKEAECADISAKLADHVESSARTKSESEQEKVVLNEKLQVMEKNCIQARDEVVRLTLERKGDAGQLQQLHHSLSEEKKKSQSLKSQIQQISDANKRFAAEHSKLKDAISKHLANLEKQATENQQLQEKLQKKSEELTSCELALRTLREQQLTLEEELRQSTLTADRALENQADLQCIARRLQDELDAERSSKHAEIQQLKNQKLLDEDLIKSKLRREFSDLKEKINSSAAERCEMLSQENERLKLQLQCEANEALDSEKKQEDALKFQFDILRRLETELSNSKIMLERENTDLRSKLEKQEECLHQKVAIISSLKRRTRQLEGENEELLSRVQAEEEVRAAKDVEIQTLGISNKTALEELGLLRSKMQASDQQLATLSSRLELYSELDSKYFKLREEASRMTLESKMNETEIKRTTLLLEKRDADITNMQFVLDEVRHILTYVNVCASNGDGKRFSANLHGFCANFKDFGFSDNVLLLTLKNFVSDYEQLNVDIHRYKEKAKEVEDLYSIIEEERSRTIELAKKLDQKTRDRLKIGQDELLKCSEREVETKRCLERALDEKHKLEIMLCESEAKRHSIEDSTSKVASALEEANRKLEAQVESSYKRELEHAVQFAEAAKEASLLRLAKEAAEEKLRECNENLKRLDMELTILRQQTQSLIEEKRKLQRTLEDATEMNRTLRAQNERQLSQHDEHVQRLRSECDLCSQKYESAEAELRALRLSFEKFRSASEQQESVSKYRVTTLEKEIANISKEAKEELARKGSEAAKFLRALELEKDNEIQGLLSKLKGNEEIHEQLRDEVNELKRKVGTLEEECANLNVTNELLTQQVSALSYVENNLRKALFEVHANIVSSNNALDPQRSEDSGGARRGKIIQSIENILDQFDDQRTPQDSCLPGPKSPRVSKPSVTFHLPMPSPSLRAAAQKTISEDSQLDQSEELSLSSWNVRDFEETSKSLLPPPALGVLFDSSELLSILRKN